jgi:hypothetical protein
MTIKKNKQKTLSKKRKKTVRRDSKSDKRLKQIMSHLCNVEVSEVIEMAMDGELDVLEVPELVTVDD